MGISPFQLLITLLVVVLLFGGKKLRTLGADVAHAIKGFKEVSKEDKEDIKIAERISEEGDKKNNGRDI